MSDRRAAVVAAVGAVLNRHDRLDVADLVSPTASLCTTREEPDMPFANLKVPADTLTPESKKQLIDAVTDAFANVYGERARGTTLVLVDEVPDGGWGLGGNILTAEMLGRS